MRTPKRLYAEERIIYHPELLTCLHCGERLVMWNYLAWAKTVQTLDRVLALATRPGHCPQATCPGSRMRLLSAAAQRLAPPGSTYGYDVLVHIGWLRQDPRRHPGHAGVLTMTGLWPSPVEEPPAPTCPRPAPAAPTASDPEAEQVITQRLCHTRYLLTLKGRPPFRLAGLETYERLHSVACLSLDLLAQHYEPRLAHLYQGLQAALSPFAETSQTLHQGAAWLHDIAYILEPVATYPSKAAEVARQLRGYLDTVQRQSKITPTLEAFGRHLDCVSRSYWPGLFPCYDVPGLPRTNNELESHFRETRRRLLRTTGQQGQTQRTLQRQGAWELLPPPPDRGQVTGDLMSHPIRGLDAGAAAFCSASPAFPLAESFPAPGSRAIRSTASAVVHTTAYRHRVTFAVLPISLVY